MSFSNRFICVNCGLQHGEESSAPARCVNCSDERESMTHKPQRWTTLAEMQGRYRNVFTSLGEGVTGVVTVPTFAIGPEVFLVETTAGRVLWDCFAYLDDATVTQINDSGGLSAIVISHPHMFGSVVDWSYALGRIPVFIHEDNRPWMPRLDPVIRWWKGESSQIDSALRVIRIGGHFPGSSVLHWREGAGGKGALFTGDGILPVEDRRWVSFMYSYVNAIPLSAAAVRGIAAAVAPYRFDRLYGGWWGRVVSRDARGAVLRSAERYIRHLEG